VLVLLLACVVPVRAARPLLDQGKWDNYFALFARDALVPWKRISLRLDTYSGAPVDFAAYDVDPIDVLVAGANARPRALDTSRLRPVARWRFTPPPGQRLVSSDVDVPLQNREGFFVIEARRGDAVQQVWLNLSRIGLISKESPAGSLLYAADLGNGRALSGMRLTYLVNKSFAYGMSDPHGLAHIPAHAIFALAEWGHSKAFVSLLPQSPPPSAVVAVRADRATARAGDAVRIVGFARKREGNVYRPQTGEVALTMVARGRTLASGHATLDASGAFTTSLDVPDKAPAGDAAILATAGGTSGGATIHLDGIGDVALAIVTTCTSACSAADQIPFTVIAKRDGVPAPGRQIRVRVVRSPHVLPPDTPLDAPAWGLTTVIDGQYVTDATGVAHVAIPGPTDGLASTYGVTAADGASTATTNLVAPTAKMALSIVPDRASIDVSDASTLTVRGFDAFDGSPAAGAQVLVALRHGPTVQQQQVTLGGDGTARVTFHDIALGMNLASAATQTGGRPVLDIASVTVAPSASIGGAASSGADMKIALDHARYRPGDRVTVNATLAGAQGDALVTMESVRGVTTDVVAAANGSAAASLTVPETIGQTTIGVAFVRDGAIVNASVPLAIDGPGHQRQLTLTADRATYAPGSTARIAIDDGDDRSSATLAVRVSDRRAAVGAAFDDAPSVLASSGTTTQNLSSTDPSWHTWVAPAQSKAGDVFGFDRPRQAAAPPQITAAATRVLTWSVDRVSPGPFDVTVPAAAGRYVLSVVKITDDGDVGASTIALTVQ
jgi:hypothetical protein